ncbi:MAG: DUF1667 domain-containing protein [Lachnospiraceae bacterium]
MLTEMTCIMCPAGCDLEVAVSDNNKIEVSGNLCPKGNDYARQEIAHPMRNIATSVLVVDGELPLTSVRLNQMIEKDKIFAVMEEIKKAIITAPVQIGDIILENVASTGSDVIVTRNVKRR